jgi:hypothetical protein
MRVSHFAKLEVIVPPSDYSPGGSSEATLRTVGMAQNIRVEDNFGSRAENTIGTPLPVLAPGYQQTTVNIEKATIDGADFRNLGAFNPLWAHIGATYNNPRVSIPFSQSEALSDGIYPFMFVVRVRNKVSGAVGSNNASLNSNIQEDNTPIPQSVTGASANARRNSFGVYACVLQSASISVTSQQAVIMDSVSAIARPIEGTWLNDQIRNAFSNNASGSEDVQNGMRQLIYNVVYGYES